MSEVLNNTPPQEPQKPDEFYFFDVIPFSGENNFLDYSEYLTLYTNGRQEVFWLERIHRTDPSQSRVATPETIAVLADKLETDRGAFERLPSDRKRDEYTRYYFAQIVSTGDWPRFTDLLQQEDMRNFYIAKKSEQATR